MRIKTFRARSLREALAEVRAEFGAGAAVLHTREVNAGPVSRWLGRSAIEVAATPDHSPLAAQAAANGAVEAGLKRTTQGSHWSGQETPAVAESHDTPASPHVAEYARLIEADVASALAGDLVRVAKREDAESVTHADVVAAFQQRISVSGPIDPGGEGCRVVALVGPTGVGKTTTLAKLAANFRLRDGVRVGLVTVDTYRTAAVEQLRTYAEIIDLPMEVVETPEQMPAAIDRFADLDLVLIDTAGRSPRDAGRIEELRSLLAAASPDETHLVLGVNATSRGLLSAVERFAATGPTSLLLTKLDEAAGLGHVAEVVDAARLPVSYLTDGQSVPEDIGVARIESLASMLLGGAG